MKCSNPLDATTLADYWLALLTKPEEEAVEEHLFSCDECGARLREQITLAEGVRKLAGEGALRMVVSDAFLKRATEEGLRVHEYALRPGDRVECTVTADDDLLVGRLAADLSGRTASICASATDRASNSCGCPIFPFPPEPAACSTKNRSLSRRPRLRIA